MRLKMLRIFWVRRWFRTLPLYYLILVANVALHQYVGGYLATLWGGSIWFFCSVMMGMP